MHRIDGFGFRRCAQVGGNPFRGSHFQNVHQDWPNESRIQSELPNDTARQRCTPDIANEGRKLRNRNQRRNSFVNNAAQPELYSVPKEREFASLRHLSARLGNNPLLVQASNGNTSIKFDEILWIKASGKWLAHAMQEEMFAPQELAKVRESIQKDIEIPPYFAVTNGIRPSIETPMHAILRHRVVIHVHSINAIAWAIRLDGPDQLRERLAGLHWQWIPYTASGIPLAREIEKAVASAPHVDVLILGNHGLVVCGQNCETAEKLLMEVERRLAITPRRIPKPDATVLSMIARFSNWQFPDVDTVHALGTDSVSRKILKGGVLYPCQAV